MHFQKDALGKTVIDKSVQRSTQASAEQTRREVGKTDNSSKDKLGIGPFVLGLFMFCILCNCLLYVYQQSKSFLATYEATKDVVINKAVSPSVIGNTDASWHRIASIEDVDYLRIALRTALVEDRAKKTTKTSMPVQWRNPDNHHAGAVTIINNDAGISQSGCHPFRITRRIEQALLSDQIYFCADGSIRAINH